MDDPVKAGVDDAFGLNTEEAVGCNSNLLAEAVDDEVKLVKSDVG